TEPKTVSLSGAPNFITFESKPAVKTFLEINVAVNLTAANAGASTIQLVEPSGVVHAFRGSALAADVVGTTFYISTDLSDTAENLRTAMLANRWIAANLDIRIPAQLVGSQLSNGMTLNIKS